jgi:Gas vesicle synthesis protein GvpO
MADASAVLREAMAQFEELTGLRPESVSAMRREDDGWTLRVEVVELQRVPDTTSLLATYELQLDTDGGLAGWARVARYERGRADRH